MTSFDNIWHFFSNFCGFEINDSMHANDVLGQCVAAACCCDVVDYRERDSLLLVPFCENN